MLLDDVHSQILSSSRCKTGGSIDDKGTTSNTVTSSTYLYRGNVADKSFIITKKNKGLLKDALQY